MSHSTGVATGCLRHGLLALTVLLLGAACGPAPAQAPETAADQALDLANGLFDQQQWDRALEKYEQFIKASPQSPNGPFALFRAGECHYNLQRWEKALACYQRIVGEAATAEVFDEALYRTGDTYYRLGRSAEATRAFSQLLEKSPKSPLAFRAAYWLGETQYREGKYTEAIAAYEQSLQMSPDGSYAAYASYSISLCKVRLGEAKEGVTRLEALLAKYPKHELVPEVLYRLGEGQYAARNYEAALARYQQVLKEYPGTTLAPLAQSGVAWSYWSLGKYAEALPAFERVKQAADAALAAEAALRAADCLYLLQRYAEAATAYGAIAAAKGPQAGTALLWQGMALERKGEKAGARRAFEQFVTTEPQHERVAEAYLHLGALQVEAGQLAAAAQSYAAAEAKTQDPDLKAQARYGAAWAAYQQDNSEASLAAVERLADEAPGTALGAQVAYQTGKLRFARGDYARAIQLLSGLVESQPAGANTPEAVYLLAAAYDRAQNAARAEEFYRRYLETYKQGEYVAESLGGLVAMYARAGRLDVARAMLEDLRKRYPKEEAVSVAQYALGERLLAAKDYQAAAPYYAEVLAAKNAELAPYAQYSLGACRFGTGEYAPAAEAFRAVLTAYPGAPTATPAKYQLAVCLSRLGQAAEAAKLLTELLAANSTAEPASSYLMELGANQLELKQPQAALATFGKLLAQFAQSPQAPEAAFRSGEIRYDSGDFAGAQASYERLLTDYPKSELADEAAYKLGWALLKQDKPDEALKHFRTASEAAGDAAVAADARYQAASILLKQGAGEEAARLLDPVATKAPGNLAPRLLLLLGQAYLEAKQPEKALPVFQQILDKYGADPLAARAQLGLGRCQKAGKKLEEAATSFTRVTGMNEPQAAMEAQFELAETRMLQNDPRAAALEYAKVGALYSQPEWGARAQYAAGLCYEQARAPEEAAKAYRTVLEKYRGQEEWVRKASERLKALE